MRKLEAAPLIPFLRNAVRRTTGRDVGRRYADVNGTSISGGQSLVSKVLAGEFDRVHWNSAERLCEAIGVSMQEVWGDDLAFRCSNCGELVA